MIKNRTAQLVFKTAYCLIGLIGIIASFGVFDDDFFAEVYIYFTNWSNYLCFIIMLIELTHIIKEDKDSFAPYIGLLKFTGLLSILITFWGYNFPFVEVEAITKDIAASYKVNSIVFHLVLPIMYFLDWILFYNRKNLKWMHLVYSTVFPVTYIIFILIRIKFLRSQNLHMDNLIIYPYFFFDIDKQGWAGVFNWCVTIIMIFIAVGFVFVIVDRLVKASDSIKEK